MNISRPVSAQQMPPHATRVFEGDIFDIYQWEQELYDGSKKIFEKARRDDTVGVIPILPDKRIIVLEDEQPSRPMMRTFPTGRMDKEGEDDPLVTAKRELREETGYVSDEWELWKAYQPVTKVDWAVYLFIARNCRKEGEPELDAGEKITLHIKTFDEILELSATDPLFITDGIVRELTSARYNADARTLLEKTLFG